MTTGVLIRREKDALVGTKSRGDGVRADIQGLRAVAVALVVLFHLWNHGWHGGFVGVDVFFVISGFLITSHLLTKPPQTWSDLGGFWARRIRRLLPAALTVLAVSLAAARMIAPETQWKNTGQQIMAATMYWQNWHLAGQSVDYLKEDSPPTVAQHFWSLSVEEQFYMVWPLLLAATVIAARLLSRRLAPLVAMVVSVPLVASLTWSIIYTKSHPAQAYFVTTTRIWELAIGALLAALVKCGAAHSARRKESPGRLGAVLRPIVAWAGYGAIAYSVATFGSSNFPGAKAMIPVLGTAAVIAANDRSPFTPNRLLALRPAQYLGDISYSVYLWHWPLIVLVPYATHHGLRNPERFGIMAAAVVCSGLTKRYIEDRFRRPRAARSLVIPFRWAVAGMAALVGLSVMQIQEVDRRENQQLRDVRLASAAAAANPCFGANSMRADRKCVGIKPDEAKIVPSPIVAPKDMSFSYNYDCQLKLPFTGFKSCVFGDQKATRNVALVGNSHAIHWLPALQQVALAEHFKITTFFSEQCFATTVPIKFDTRAETDNCLRWGQQVMNTTKKGAFDLVITSERTYMSPLSGGGNKAFQQGYTSYVKNWLNANRRVLVLRDVPHPATTVEDVPNCVAQHRHQLTACEGTRSSWMHKDPLADAVRALKSKKASVANLTDWFCTKSTCPAVIGGAMVYFDGSHITATYARTLVPVLEPIVAKAMGSKKVVIPAAAAGKEHA
jgi:peptidoglycan/LPS O-acetylase OafA/YrhL